MGWGGAGRNLPKGKGTGKGRKGTGKGHGGKLSAPREEERLAPPGVPLQKDVFEDVVLVGTVTPPSQGLRGT